MFKDVLGKINDAIPEDMKTQAKEKLNQEISEQLEGAKKRFFGDAGGESSQQTAAAPETETAEAESAEAENTEAGEVEDTETAEPETVEASSDDATSDSSADTADDQDQTSKEVA